MPSMLFLALAVSRSNDEVVAMWWPNGSLNLLRSRTKVLKALRVLRRTWGFLSKQIGALVCLLSWSDSELTSKVITPTQTVIHMEKFICQGALIGESGLGPGLHELAPNCLSLPFIYIIWHLESYFYFLAVKVHTCVAILSFLLFLFSLSQSLSFKYFSPLKSQFKCHSLPKPFSCKPWTNIF